MEVNEGADTLVRDVVSPYYWGTDGVFCKRGDDWPMFYTSTQGDLRGKLASGDWLEPGVDGRGFCFKMTGRLLIEQIPQGSAPLINNWKRYVQLSAEKDWGARLEVTA